MTCIYSLAYGRVFPLAPKNVRIGSRKTNATAMKIVPMMRFRETMFPNTLDAPL